MKVDESNYDTLQKASEITDVDYEIQWKNAENITGYIELDALVDMIKDLIYEYGVLQEKYEGLDMEYEDFKREVREDYKYVGTTEPDWHDISDYKPSWWVD